jgi:hypothetical protein
MRYSLVLNLAAHYNEWTHMILKCFHSGKYILHDPNIHQRIYREWISYLGYGQFPSDYGEMCDVL